MRTGFQVAPVLLFIPTFRKKAMSETVSIGVLFLCVMLLFAVVLFLVSVIVHERSHVPMLAAHPLLSTFKSNRLFTGFEDVDFVVISLPKRQETHFKVVEASLKQEGIEATLFHALDGKLIDLDHVPFPITDHYRQFFVNNARDFAEGKTKTNYRGHLGATMSHMTIFQQMKNMTVILEDDVDHHDNFRNKLQAALATVTTLDPNWDILLLGMTANYKDHSPHKLNDREPIYEGGIVRVRAHIGGWAYVVRSAAVAQKILQNLNPLFWHIDLALSELNQQGKLVIYGCIPTICDHAGPLRSSSWDWTGVGKWDTLKSDTNN